MQARGQVTERIKAESKKLLGYEIDQTELRLMPYIMHVMMNDQKIDPHKINGEERSILSKWRKADHIEGGISGLRVTEEFWMILSRMMLLGYVDID